MESLEQKIYRKLNEARDLYLKKKYAEALQNYQWVAEQIYDDEENLPIVLIEMGWCCYQMQDYPNTIKYLKQALESKIIDNQQQFDCLRIIGFSYLMQNQKNEAIQYLKQAMRVSLPEEVEKRFIYFELGKIYFNNKNLNEAKIYLHKAWDLFREKEESYKNAVAYYLGFAEFSSNNPDLANKYFNHLIQNSTETRFKVLAYFGKAHLFLKNKEYPALVDVCEKIIRLDANFEDKETLGYFLCIGYLHLKMWDELEKFFMELKNTFPTGRYKDSYPIFEEAIQKRELPGN